MEPTIKKNMAFRWIWSYCLIALYLISCQAIDPNAELIKHPNVLFISIDDLNDWVEPLSGHPQSSTPNLSAFANEAVNFKHSYCASPGCNPSRSALLSGRHTFRSGMYSNYQDWRKVGKITEHPTLPHYFRQNGYYTAGAGKIFHYSQVDTLAWDDYFPAIKNPMPQEVFPDKRPASMPRFKYMYNMFDWSPINVPDTTTSDFRSVDFIADQLRLEHDKPFFLACGIYRPHLPWYVPQEYFERFPLKSIQLPKTKENDLDDLGGRAKELIKRGGNYHKHVVEARQWKQAVQGYLASIAYADAMVGHLLSSLDDSDYADNTIVIIWSDHGWQLGEKQHWRKFALWENVIRTVLMIKAPKGISKAPDGTFPGQTANTLTSLVDIYPTLLDLCSIPQRDDLDGEILTPFLANPDSIADRPILTTYDFGDYSVRFGQWHYIKYVDASEELYDLDKDPEEWNNLAGEVEYYIIKKKLRTFLPKEPVPLPEESLIPLMEHHIPPVKSKEYYFSDERREWMKRFEDI